MENKETGKIIGSQSAPFINSLAAQFGQAQNYFAISHPSLPNYLALTGGRTFGITTDCTNCFVPDQNIVRYAGERRQDLEGVHGIDAPALLSRR